MLDLLMPGVIYHICIITALLKSAPSAVEDINCNNQNWQNLNRQESY